MINTKNIKEPYIINEDENYAVVYKPHKMHCAPLDKYINDTLLDWYGNINGKIYDIFGKKNLEGGLIHRLDYETEGIVLFTKNQKYYDYIQNQQKLGKFIKRYNAICNKTTIVKSGFPVYEKENKILKNDIIESYFRPFGKGRKEVRPVFNNKYKEIVMDNGSYYKTKILDIDIFNNNKKEYKIITEIKRGFRHQIRCHLAWIGFPIVNDHLYGINKIVNDNKYLALSAYEISFYDFTNKKIKYKIKKNNHE